MQPLEGVLSPSLWLLSAGSSEALPQFPLLLVVPRNPEATHLEVTQSSACPPTTLEPQRGVGKWTYPTLEVLSVQTRRRMGAGGGPKGNQSKGCCQGGGACWGKTLCHLPTSLDISKLTSAVTQGRKDLILQPSLQPFQEQPQFSFKFVIAS